MLFYCCLSKLRKNCRRGYSSKRLKPMSLCNVLCERFFCKQWQTTAIV